MISRNFKGGHVAFVDDEDARLLLGISWHVHKGRHTYYLSRLDYVNGKAKRVYLHRRIMDAERGVQVDHQDGNGLNCRRENLRKATNAQNHAGKINRPAHFASPYRGVYLQGQNKNWCAQIKVAGKKRHLGSFADEREAAAAYNRAATKSFGEFAQLNKI